MTVKGPSWLDGVWKLGELKHRGCPHNSITVTWYKMITGKCRQGSLEKKQLIYCRLLYPHRRLCIYDCKIIIVFPEKYGDCSAEKLWRNSPQILLVFIAHGVHICHCWSLSRTSQQPQFKNLPQWIVGIGQEYEVVLNKLDTVMRPWRKYRKHSHPHFIVSHSVIRVWGENAQIRSKDVSLFVDSIQSRGGKWRGGRSHSECPKGMSLQSWRPLSKPFTYSG